MNWERLILAAGLLFWVLLLVRLVQWWIRERRRERQKQNEWRTHQARSLTARRHGRPIADFGSRIADFQNDQPNQQTR